MLYVNPLAVSPALSGTGSAGAATADDPARRRLAEQELEHYFAYMLLEEMRKTVPKDTLLKSGSEAELHNQLLDDAFAGEIARTGQLGIAKMMEEQYRIAALQRQFRAASTVK